NVAVLHLDGLGPPLDSVVVELRGAGLHLDGPGLELDRTPLELLNRELEFPERARCTLQHDSGALLHNRSLLQRLAERRLYLTRTRSDLIDPCSVGAVRRAGPDQNGAMLRTFA